MLQCPEMGRRVIQVAENDHNWTNMHTKHVFYTGNSISGQREAFGTGPEPQDGPKRFKKLKNVGFSRQGNFTPVRGKGFPQKTSELCFVAALQRVWSFAGPVLGSFVCVI